jgi:threonine dehydratase
MGAASRKEPPDAAPAVTRDDIEAAARRVAGRVRRTPVMALEPGAFGVPGRISLKLELLQHVGSFKPRGAFNLLLAREVPAAGVAAASGGNFGLAVAYAARELGHRATIFVPEVTSAAKRDKLARLGADVVVGGAFYAEALEASRAFAEETGALLAHAYDQPEVVAGQGTCGREMAEQLPDVDTVLVAVGGGGLIGGIAAWFGGEARVVSVESERTPTLARALEAGRPVDVEVSGVTADALGARRVGEIAWEIARQWVDRAVLVPDEAVVDAQRRLWDSLRIAGEPAGVASLAALLAGAYVPEPGEHVCVLLCGANVDPASLSAV